ncbi:MAG: hypothetical protein CL521_02170 [Actinobacteria bacterium]|nr:hypothetical protein [Actinomycetota bacterium]
MLIRSHPQFNKPLQRLFYSCLDHLKCPYFLFDHVKQRQKPLKRQKKIIKGSPNSPVSIVSICEKNRSVGKKEKSSYFYQ